MSQLLPLFLTVSKIALKIVNELFIDVNTGHTQFTEYKSQRGHTWAFQMPVVGRGELPPQHFINTVMLSKIAS